MGSVCALKGTQFGPAAAERPRDSRIGRRTRWKASRAGREGWARAATMGRGFGVSTAFQAQRDRVDECGIVAHAKERRVHEHLRAAARSAKPNAPRAWPSPGAAEHRPSSPHRESPRPFPNQRRVSQLYRYNSRNGPAPGGPAPGGTAATAAAQSRQPTMRRDGKSRAALLAVSAARRARLAVQVRPELRLAREREAVDDRLGIDRRLLRLEHAEEPDACVRACGRAVRCGAVRAHARKRAHRCELHVRVRTRCVCAGHRAGGRQGCPPQELLMLDDVNVARVGVLCELGDVRPATDNASRRTARQATVANAAAVPHGGSRRGGPPYRTHGTADTPPRAIGCARPSCATPQSAPMDPSIGQHCERCGTDPSVRTATPVLLRVLTRGDRVVP